MEQVPGTRQESVARSVRLQESVSNSLSSDVVQIPIERIRVWGSPRVAGEDSLHVQALVEVVDHLPPIVVHRRTLTVIDGVHRLRALQRVGARLIDAVYFDGDAREAFVLAVQANCGHGLPLSLADRKAAAVRILGEYSEWSNRRIAVVVGLSDKTVAVIRRRAGAENPHQPGERVGRDGVSYPIESGERRRLALEFLESHPDASSKEVALATGISLTTAKRSRSDFREIDSPAGRQSEGMGSIAERDSAAPETSNWQPAEELTASIEQSAEQLKPSNQQQSAGEDRVHDLGTVVRGLRADPALRFTEHGRKLIRMLDALPVEPAMWKVIVDNLPNHCASQVIELSRQHSQNWQRLADALTQRQDLKLIASD
ncbi:ParB N-terminal domain-containing protein [Nocardia salmonicida]|uniref:ParB N-terminal domain-containing protein n=1 Tax=Nocardia salmonicida TaxID=53431 RepID=UPI003CEA072F